jgi:hypothetical protein
MEARVKSAIGIRHIIDLLSSERKLIVGHSSFLGTQHFVLTDTSMRSNFIVDTWGDFPCTVIMISSHENFCPDEGNLNQ